MRYLSSKAAAVLMLLLAVQFVSCDRLENLIGCDEEPEFSTCQEVVFADPGFCSGMWFCLDNGDYLEVFGMEDKLSTLPKEGETIEMSFTSFDDSEVVQCEAISAFEKQLCDDGVTIYKVHVQELCGVEAVENCSFDCTNMTLMDDGICGGKWFSNEAGELFEVFGFESRTTTEIGTEVIFSYECFDETTFLPACSAMTDFELQVFKDRTPYTRVNLASRCE